MARRVCALLLLVSMTQARAGWDDNIQLLINQVVEAAKERVEGGDDPDQVAREAAHASADAIEEFGNLDGKSADEIFKEQISTSQHIVQEIMQASSPDQLKRMNTAEKKSETTLEQQLQALEAANAAQQAELKRLREGTKGKIATWVMGQDSENCDQACNRAELECDSRKMWEKNEEAALDQIANLVTVLGATCYKFDDTRGHDQDVPAKSSETCFVTTDDRAQNTVDCAQEPRTSEVRMCWCTVIGRKDAFDDGVFDAAGAVIPNVG